MATTEISIGADISALRQELGKLDGISDKEARAMVNKLNKQMKRAEKASKKAAQASSRAWSKTGQGLKSMLSDVVPGFSALEGKIGTLTSSFGMAGPAVAVVTAGIAAYGAAAAAAAFGAFKLASAASAYVDEIGMMAKGTGLTMEEVAALSAASTALGTDFEKLRPGLGALVTKMGEFSRGSESAKEQFAGIADPMDHTTGKLKSTGQVLREVVLGFESIDDETEKATKRIALFGGEAAIVMASLEGGSAVMEEYADKADGMFSEQALASSAAMDKALSDISFATDRLVLVLGSELGPSVADVIMWMAEGVDTTIKYKNTIAELGAIVLAQLPGIDLLGQAFFGMESSGKNAADAWAAWNDESRDTTRTAEEVADKLRAQQEAAEKARAAAEKLRKEQQEEAAAAKARAAAEKAATAATKAQTAADREAAAVIKEKLAAGKEWASSIMQDYGTVYDMTAKAVESGKSAEVKALNEAQEKYEELSRIIQRRPEMAEQVSAAIVAVEGETSAKVTEIHTASAQEQSDMLTSTRDDLLSSTASTFGQLADMLASHGEQNKDAAMMAFRVSQAAALSEVAIHTSVAAMRAYRDLPPPANVIASGAYVALGAVQAGMIAAQSPPTFHSGGMIGASPDERLVTARAGEGVLTPQGVNAIGGPAGLAAANRGSAAPMQITVVQQYKHRAFGAFVQEDLKLSNSPLRQAIVGNVRVGHRRD
jgi:hypothetical protein